jgi:hypothetical protein
MVRNGNWEGATGADIGGGLLGHSGLPSIQEDGEVLGSDASTGEKIWAVVNMVQVGASWYFVLRGSEIDFGKGSTPERVAPAGNRAWRPGYEEPTINQLPHYHRRVPNPARPGESLPGQGIGRHRPWQGGF